MSRFIVAILKFWLVGWTLLLLGRVGLAVLFLSPGQLLADTASFPLASWNILRFDFQTLAYLAALPLLLSIIAVSVRRFGWWSIFARWYYTIVYTLLTILTICDLGFYKNFASHLNITMFDFFNELPLTLLQTLWEDYPVIPGVLLIFVVAIAVSLLGKRIVSPLTAAACGTWKPNVILSLLSIVFIVVCMRGSVTEFPLQIEDTCVSSVKQLNDCVPNAVYALKTAWKEKKNAFRMGTPEEILAEYQFGSEQEALQTLGIDSLFATASVPVQTDVPLNIVLVFSESWSGYLCHDNINRPDVMLGMDKHMKQDLWFRNYQSVHNGTIASVENFVMATSFPRVFQSGYRFQHLGTSVANPFGESGYKTIFMTGMDKAWENVGEGLTLQGFDEVQSKYELLARHPEYAYNSIGVYDHHLFNSLLEQLKEPASQPRFYYVLTTTNHPPYVYPDDVELPLLPDSYYDRSIFCEERPTLQKIIRGFQYANYSMAQFLDALKHSPAADRTVVIITGDHNVRGTLRYEDMPGAVPVKWAHAVPLYVYLPKALRGTQDASYAVDTSRYGSHYDLLPTLAPLAFCQGVRYLNVGKDMLADSIAPGSCWSYNVDALLSAEKDSAVAERKARARECLLRLYFQRQLPK